MRQPKTPNNGHPNKKASSLQGFAQDQALVHKKMLNTFIMNMINTLYTYTIVYGNQNVLGKRTRKEEYVGSNITGSSIFHTFFIACNITGSLDWTFIRETKCLVLIKATFFFF